MIEGGGCLSYLADLFRGEHKPEHIYKFALFDSSANLTRKTTSYKGVKGECYGQGYTAGGAILSGHKIKTKDDSVALGFNQKVEWLNATITARAGLVYNDSLPNKNAVTIIDFNHDIKSTNGPFTVQLDAEILALNRK